MGLVGIGFVEKTGPENRESLEMDPAFQEEESPESSLSVLDFEP